MQKLIIKAAKNRLGIGQGWNFPFVALTHCCRKDIFGKQLLIIDGKLYSQSHFSI